MDLYPEGDPEAMHELAADLRRAASVAAAAPHPSVEGWSSPAANRTRALLDHAAGTADRVAGDLRDCASRLDAAAHRLATDQREWKAAQRRSEKVHP